MVTNDWKREVGGIRPQRNRQPISALKELCLQESKEKERTEKSNTNYKNRKNYKETHKGKGEGWKSSRKGQKS